MKKHVYSILAKRIVCEEKKEPLLLMGLIALSSPGLCIGGGTGGARGVNAPPPPHFIKGGEGGHTLG